MYISRKNRFINYLAKKNIILSDENNENEYYKIFEAMHGVFNFLNESKSYDNIEAKVLKDTQLTDKVSSDDESAESLESKLKYFFAKNEKYKEFEKKIQKQLEGSNFTYIPREAIAKLSFRQMLVHSKKLKFCCNFNHSSSIGAITVKNEAELTMLESQTKDLIENTPFLSQPQYEYFNKDEQLKAFEKKAIKEQLIQATVIHTDDIMQDFRKNVIEY